MDPEGSEVDGQQQQQQEQEPQQEPQQDQEDGNQVGKKEKMCSYYVTERGCIKGESCDFKHPKAPNGSETNRVCDFFLSQRGCSKAELCNFLHLGTPPEKTEGDQKLCNFYITPRGCIKGEKCDFMHPTAPNGTVTTRICEYYLTPRGCSKDKKCDFLHHGGRPQFATPFGAPSGRTGSFPPTFAPRVPVAPKPAVETQGSIDGNTRVCEFYQSQRGCIKGTKCDFLHTEGSSVPSNPAPSYPTPYQNAYQNPYQNYGGGYSGGSSVPSSSSSSKTCSFFNTERGCIKGDSCDFSHVSGTPQVVQPVQQVAPSNPYYPQQQQMVQQPTQYQNYGTDSYSNYGKTPTQGSYSTSKSNRYNPYQR